MSLGEKLRDHRQIFLEITMSLGEKLRDHRQIFCLFRDYHDFGKKN